MVRPLPVLAVSAAVLIVFCMYTGLRTAGDQATLVYGLAMLYLATVHTVVRRNALSYGWVWAAMFVGGCVGLHAHGSFYPGLYHGYDRVRAPAGEPLFWTSVCMAGSSVVGAVGWVMHNLFSTHEDLSEVPQDIC